MKGKKIGILLGIMLLITGLGVGATALMSGTHTKKDNKLNIVTSFSPIYVATANVVADMEDINLVNLMEKQEGCLHDYQLTTTEMRKLEDADVFIMNGAGMEGFIEDIVKAYPNLTIIDTSVGATLLEGITHDHDAETETEDHDHDHETETEDHDHDHETETEDHDHDHGSENAHIWMDMDNYMIQIRNIQNGLAKLSSSDAGQLEDNANAYIEKVENLKAEFGQLKDLTVKDVVIFHDAFAYLAHMLGVNVVYEVDVDGESTLNAGEVAEVIDEVKLHDIKVLLTEEQLSDTIADRIAKETGATVYVIDSLVTGQLDKDSYLKGQEANLKVLKEALQ